MKILILLAAVIVLLSAFAIQVKQEAKRHQSDISVKIEDKPSKIRPFSSINKPVTINWSLLQEFPSQAGETFGDTELKSLITILNNASNIYGGDVASNFKYIKSVMDATFGDLNNQYNVVLQSALVRDFGSSTVYCLDGTNYAFIGYGVNLKYAHWTYLVYKVYAPGTAYNYLMNAIGRGSGLNADQGDKITYIVQAVDGTAACSCNNTYTVKYKIENVLKGSWNAICQSTQNIYSYVAIVNSTWIMLKPQNCVYFIYSI